MRIGISLVVLLVGSPLFAADRPFFIEKNDRIVFLGDSITERYKYSTDIELHATTRFPDWNLTFLNAWIGGDTANGGAGRFQAHVLDEKPTAVTINFGMNDAGYQKFDAGPTWPRSASRRSWPNGWNRSGLARRRSTNWPIRRRGSGS